jgi:hypothetical protein
VTYRDVLEQKGTKERKKKKDQKGQEKSRIKKITIVIT